MNYKTIVMYTSFMCVVLCPLCVVSVNDFVTMFLFSPMCITCHMLDFDYK